MTCDPMIESVWEETVKMNITVNAERPESAAFEPIKMLCPIKNLHVRDSALCSVSPDY